MILTSQQLYDLHNPNYAANQSLTLTVPLSEDGWNRIHEIMESIPGMTLAELIEKALVLAWHADDKELA